MNDGDGTTIGEGAEATAPVAIDAPRPPEGREVVLHTRVVTETGGGPDKTILLSASHMDDTPYWLAAAYMHPPGDDGFATLRQRADEVGCPLISVPDRGPLDRGVFRDLLEICRQYNVRIWHGHDYKSNLLGLTLRPFHDMKLVSTVHGWVKRTLKTPLYYAVDRWCLPYYHHVICVSEDLRERVRSLNVADERISLIHNAIDERRFRRSVPAARAPMRLERGVPPERLVIGAVGRLSPEKAFGHLIRAAEQLAGEGLDFEVWIAGDGDARDDLQTMIDRLGLQERVRLLGFVSDTIALYHAMDAYVLSSLREGLPNVLLEAMAMHVPVVSTRVAGVPKLIRDDVSGLLCDPGEVEQLTAACRRVLTDAALRRRLADAGRDVIESRFSFARRMERVRAIYDQVLGLPQAVAQGQSA
ncbi:MAG: glycosyl transferase family 1 [Phycisphaeraceae bacterium]|nr:glycosyl transferase family 1 [Phycisphaeraceae bacterium]